MSNSIQILIERLEKLREGDRKTDKEIADLIIGSPRPYDESEYDGDLRYTSSIDAALTLVPKSFGGSLLIPFGTNSRFPLAMIWKGKNPGINVRAANPAIALCIAALKARLT